MTRTRRCVPAALVHLLVHVLVTLAVGVAAAVVAPVAVAGRPSGTAHAEPLAPASRFVALPPARVLDTRTGIGAPAAPVPPDSTLDVRITGQGGVPANGVTAVVLNVTATRAIGAGYVQVFPTGQATVGSSSNLNVERADETIPNLVAVP